MDINKRIFSVIVCVNLLFNGTAFAQTMVKSLSLPQVIQLAKDQSLDSYVARNKYIGSYWQYRTYKADYLPSISLDATLPDLNRSIVRQLQDDGTDKFVSQKTLSNYGGLSISQNVGFTGGALSVKSELERVDLLDMEGESSSYRAIPLSLTYVQPLFAFNPYRWDRKIEPLKFEEAKKNYLAELEGIAQKAVDLFYDQMLDQINLRMAETNYANADTIYKIAQGRYNIGTIAQNELLQTELSFLNAGSSLNEARLNQEVSRARLRSFLGYNEKMDLNLVLSDEIPQFEVDVVKAKELALANNPLMFGLKLEEMQAERQVAQARAENRFRADLNASFGLNQSGASLKKAYQSPEDWERLRVGLSIPILDWGKGKGKYRIAQSNREVARLSVRQSAVDFEQNVYLQVMRFNMQDEQLSIAIKADAIAQSRYEVTKSRYFIGKVGVLDLNVALTEKDQAKRAYVEALRRYWSCYYSVRKLTLFDFQNQVSLQQNFDDILN
ncbi:MAG: TolC family protein [Marinifilaceae bacterium]